MQRSRYKRSGRIIITTVRWLLGESKAYIGALEHEAFHA
jgi:hypothetical protein